MRRHYLQRHLATEESPYHCRVCHFRALQLSELQKHVNSGEHRARVYLRSDVDEKGIGRSNWSLTTGRDATPLAAEESQRVYRLMKMGDQQPAGDNLPELSEAELPLIRVDQGKSSAAEEEPDLDALIREGEQVLRNLSNGTDAPREPAADNLSEVSDRSFQGEESSVGPPYYPSTPAQEPLPASTAKQQLDTPPRPGPSGLVRTDQLCRGGKKISVFERKRPAKKSQQPKPSPSQSGPPTSDDEVILVDSPPASPGSEASFETEPPEDSPAAVQAESSPAAPLESTILAPRPGNKTELPEDSPAAVQAESSQAAPLESTILAPRPGNKSELPKASPIKPAPVDTPTATGPLVGTDPDPRFPELLRQVTVTLEQSRQVNEAALATLQDLPRGKDSAAAKNTLLERVVSLQERAHAREDGILQAVKDLRNSFKEWTKAESLREDLLERVLNLEENSVRRDGELLEAMQELVGLGRGVSSQRQETKQSKGSPGRDWKSSQGQSKIPASSRQSTSSHVSPLRSPSDDRRASDDHSVHEDRARQRGKTGRPHHDRAEDEENRSAGF